MVAVNHDKRINPQLKGKEMDATKWADTMGLMLIGSNYGLNKDSTDADFRRAAEQAIKDVKEQQGVILSNADGLAKAFRRALDDRTSWRA